MDDSAAQHSWIGAIFGAVAGTLYGPVAFIWIVVGCIVAGGVHDYFSGMLSLRHGGAQFLCLYNII